jgi:hypothetical protein
MLDVFESFVFPGLQLELQLGPFELHELVTPPVLL